MKIIFKNSAGFSMVGALTAAGIGAIAVLGLTQMSSNIVNNLSKSKQIFNIVTLSEEIRQGFMEDAPTPCNPSEKSCWNACTSSLINISTAVGTNSNFAIKAPSPMPAGMGAGPELYKGEKTYKGIKIQEIIYKPYSSNFGYASVHFSLTEDTRETLTAPKSLHFPIFVSKKSSGVIKECVVANTKIAGAGLSGIGDSCRKVDGDPADTPPHPGGKKQTLLGCGGTDGRNGGEKPKEDVAFGYKSGGDFDADSGAGKFSDGEGNTFFGYKSGWKNTSGEHNVFLGHEAGRENTTGNNNIFLGHQAGWKNTTGSNNILIGRKVVLSAPTDSNILNIGNLITADKLYLAAPDFPTVKLEGQVQIRPPVDLPIADPPGTPPTEPDGFFSSKTTPEPGLFVSGNMNIKKKSSSPPKITFQATGTKANPKMRLITTLLKITKQDRSITPPNHPDVTVTMSAGGIYSTLLIRADLKVDGSATGSGPGLDVQGPIKLTDRNSPDLTPTDTIHIDAIADTDSPPGPRVEIDGGLKTLVSGTSEFKKSLRIKQNFDAVTGKIKNLDVKGTGHFKADIKVTQDVAKVVISGRAEIQTATIDNVQFGSLTTKQTRESGPPDLINPDSHIHGPHTHSMYVPVGHSHPCNCILPTCQGCNNRCCGGCYGPPCPPTPPPPSSRTLKRNIKSLRDYEKSLKDIMNTPLFTWQYKKDKGDHPEKVRMGIISEELPKSLQILAESNLTENRETNKKQKDSQAKKSGEKISTPDWLSIYGTLWAGIKALNQKLQELKEKSGMKLVELSKELKTYLTSQITLLRKNLTAQIENLKNQLTEIKQGTETQARSAKEFSELKKQFQKAVLTLKTRQKKLNKIRTDLKNIREQLKEAESI